MNRYLEGMKGVEMTFSTEEEKVTEKLENNKNHMGTLGDIAELDEDDIEGMEPESPAYQSMQNSLAGQKICTCVNKNCCTCSSSPDF